MYLHVYSYIHIYTCICICSSVRNLGFDKYSKYSFTPSATFLKTCSLLEQATGSLQPGTFRIDDRPSPWFELGVSEKNIGWKPYSWELKEICSCPLQATSELLSQTTVKFDIQRVSFVTLSKTFNGNKCHNLSLVSHHFMTFNRNCGTATAS